MALRVGVSIGPEIVRAVMLRRGTIVWRHEVARGTDVALTDALTELLRGIPRQRFRRPPIVFAAVTPAAAQLKRVEGLPRGASRSVLSVAVRENKARFFVQTGAPCLTSDVEQKGSDWWAAAVEARVVDALGAACSAARLPLAGCSPAASLLGRAVADGIVVRRAGSHAVEVTIENGACTRTRVVCERRESFTALHTPLAALGESAPNFIDAFAAAGPVPRAFVFDPWRGERERRARRRIRAGLCAVIIAALGTASVGPGLVLRKQKNEARVALDQLRPRAVADIRVAQLSRVSTEALERIRAFEGAQKSTALLIGRLTRTLPESTAVVSMRVDSIAGSIVAIAPVGTELLPEIAALPGIRGPKIVGALTRETVGGVRVQRTAIAFRLGGLHREPLIARPPQAMR
jgi:hypothetical protein